MKKVLWLGRLGMGTSFCRVTEEMVMFLVDRLGCDVTVVSELDNANRFQYDKFRTFFNGDITSAINNQQHYDVLVFLGSTDDAIMIKPIIKEIRADTKCCYCPVEFKNVKSAGLDHFDVVFTMTEFGKANIGLPHKTHVIPHGVSDKSFHRIPRGESRQACRDLLGFDIRPDDFIVFNGNRNEYRKRIDLTIEVFKEAKKRLPPGNRLKLWLHSASGAAAGFDPDIIVTNQRSKIQPHFTTEMLNMVYNACDVGINTSMGEGWGLVTHEMAALGIPQIAPAFSSYPELYGDKKGHALVPVTEKPIGWCGPKDEHSYEAVGGVVDIDPCVDALCDMYTRYSAYYLNAHKESEFFKNLTYDHATQKMFDLL